MINKITQILIEQKKLVILYFFLVKNKLPKVTNIHDLHREYLEFVKKVSSMKFSIGKYTFATYCQDLGVRRKRTTGASIWIQPDSYEPEDLIDLIEYRTNELKNKLS